MNETTHHLVIASWRTVQPQKDIDQYLLWINADSGLLDMVQFTIRDVAGWMEGTAKYTYFVHDNGLTLPSHVRIERGPPGSKLLHQMIFSDYRFNPPGVSSFDLLP